MVGTGVLLLGMLEIHPNGLFWILKPVVNIGHFYLVTVMFDVC